MRLFSKMHVLCVCCVLLQNPDTCALQWARGCCIHLNIQAVDEQRRLRCSTAARLSDAGEVGWERIYKACRMGCTGVPRLTSFFSGAFKTEACHAVIKTVALLADLGAHIALTAPQPFDLAAVVLRDHGLFQPVSGAQLQTRFGVCASVCCS